MVRVFVLYKDNKPSWAFEMSRKDGVRMGDLIDAFDNLVKTNRYEGKVAQKIVVKTPSAGEGPRRGKRRRPGRWAK